MGWKRTRRDAVAWRELLQRQAPSGLSQAAFCVAEGLSVSSLQSWKRKFVREGRFSGHYRLRPHPVSRSSLWVSPQ